MSQDTETGKQCKEDRLILIKAAQTQVLTFTVHARAPSVQQGLQAFRPRARMVEGRPESDHHGGERTLSC